MIAERMVEEGHTEYNANVEYLKEAQPEDIPASDISAPLGATWVPEKYINEFMYETFNTPYSHRLTEGYTSSSDIFATYSSAGGAGGWNITGKALDGYNPRVTSTYGTEYTHANAYWLLEDCLNLRQRVIKEKDFNGNLIVNQEATADAQAKQDAIKDKWSDWVFKDPQRRDELTKRYNALFNHDRLREFDGSHIQFREMNPDIELRPHQKDAVAHIIRGGNTLLAHTVGAGKTYEMIAAAMELKRLGKCTKSMIVVPKHLTEQWGHDFMKLYPGANILVATEKDFTPERRKKFCTQIATGNYDAVILGYTQFMKIPLSIERQEANLKSQIDEISNEILTENDKSWGFKQLVKFRHSLEEKLEELSKTKKDENVIDFESLGIDHLFVDEAHNYK
ncbi:MAG: DEAD/DEAH box helicase family protein, partial [Erysipelotrichaceae bacterium]|nr:DEAD/DEAH box helicase family protein [Erysipelotrichaceae bacterium]